MNTFIFALLACRDRVGFSLLLETAMRKKGCCGKNPRCRGGNKRRCKKPIVSRKQREDLRRAGLEPAPGNKSIDFGDGYVAVPLRRIPMQSPPPVRVYPRSQPKPGDLPSTKKYTFEDLEGRMAAGAPLLSSDKKTLWVYYKDGLVLEVKMKDEVRGIEMDTVLDCKIGPDIDDD